MSYAAVMLPILSVLSIAEETFLSTKRAWQASNSQQTILMHDFYPFKADLKKLLPHELKSIASQDTSQVNRFLKDNGFGLQLDEKRDAHFAVASVLKIILGWPEEGKISHLSVNDKNYPAVTMDRGYKLYTIHKSGSLYSN